MRRRDPGPDIQILGLSLTMLVFGLAMVYSSSAILADRAFGDPWHYFKRQALFCLLGLGAMFWLARTPYRLLREWVWPILGVIAVLLVGVLFTPRVAGARRWFHVGPFGLQPAEFAKLAEILFLADYLDRKRSKLHRLGAGLAVPGAVMGVILGLIALEPDLGTPALMFSVGVLMLFLGGARPAHLAGTLGLALPVLAYELICYPYRRRRLLNFLNPLSDPQGAGYQLAQSLSAVGAGGVFGAGLGGSKLKLGFLPAPHTDFIFPILCEELGLAGSLTLLSLFCWFLLRGLKVARCAPDLFGSLLAAGITLLITLQAFFNMAMSIGLLPTKGLPLPFFSYGGSSVLVTLIGVGILLNVSSQAREAPARSS